MEELIISKKSWHYKFYVWYINGSSNSNLPKSLCSYMWNLIFMILTLPITILGLVETKIFDKYKHKKAPNMILNYSTITVFNILAYLFLFFIGFGVNEKILNIFFNIESSWIYFIIPVLGILGAIVLFSIIILLIFLGVFLFTKDEDWTLRNIINNKIKSIEPKENLVIKFIKSVKGKYCPKINFK